MKRRPTSLAGLSTRLFGLKWNAATRGTKLAVVAALVMGGLFLATSARCVLNSACGASESCPYSSGAAADDSPCAR